jgi:serine/threonine-protein kinase RsbW
MRTARGHDTIPGRRDARLALTEYDPGGSRRRSAILGEESMATPQTSPCEFNADELVQRLSMIIPADSARISAVTDSIMEVVAEMGCAAGKEFEIDLAIREALANAVIHGCGKDPSKQVEVSVECDPENGMLIVVRDPGSGFDPRTVPSPIEGQNLYSSHGRGIYLINKLMDEVHFARGGTEIRMRKGGANPEAQHKAGA